MRPHRRPRVPQEQNHPRLRAARELPLNPLVIAGARARNRFPRLIPKTGTRFSRRRKSDNSSNGAGSRRAAVAGAAVARGQTGGASALLLVLVDFGKFAHPGLSRPKPILPFGHELPALA